MATLYWPSMAPMAPNVKQLPHAPWSRTPVIQLSPPTSCQSNDGSAVVPLGRSRSEEGGMATGVSGPGRIGSDIRRAVRSASDNRVTGFSHHVKLDAPPCTVRQGGSA